MKRSTWEPILGQTLTGIRRCPHCGVAHPQMTLLFKTEQPVPRGDGGEPCYWGAYACTSCGGMLGAKGEIVQRPNARGQLFQVIGVVETFPEIRTAHEDLPPTARTFLQQAFDTLHSADAAAVMAGSAVDAMLKEKGLKDGSLYSRIDKALEQNLLTKDMAEWAHEVRLGSNRPRHADENRPHVTGEEAKQSVEFADALGNFLFVLSARVERGKQAALKADTAAEMLKPGS